MLMKIKADLLSYVVLLLMLLVSAFAAATSAKGAPMQATQAAAEPATAPGDPAATAPDASTAPVYAQAAETKPAEEKPAQFGFLTFTGTPEGASVFVTGPATFGDGGKMELKLPASNLKVPEGDYRITVKKKGYAKKAVNITASMNAVEVIEFKLELLTGTVNIYGSPDGAAVRMECSNGYARDFELSNDLWTDVVPLGECVISAEKPGYVRWADSFTITEVGLPMLSISLRRVPGKAEDPEIKWVQLPGGTYTMGTDTGDANRRPAHQVTVRPFEISRTEVTVKQFKRCVEAGKCREPVGGTGCNWGVAMRGGHPMNCVNWREASAFAKWAGGRLPTEAEWEYAARSGGLDQEYPWGNDKPTCDRALIDDGKTFCGRKMTSPVCSRKAGNTRHGLCDMMGSVAEWVRDAWHNNYEGAPTDGTKWEGEGSFRVRTDKKWDYYIRTVRDFYRGYWDTDSGSPHIGFRIVRDIVSR